MKLRLVIIGTYNKIVLALFFTFFSHNFKMKFQCAIFIVTFRNLKKEKLNQWKFD